MALGRYNWDSHTFGFLAIAAQATLAAVDAPGQCQPDAFALSSSITKLHMLKSTMQLGTSCLRSGRTYGLYDCAWLLLYA